METEHAGGLTIPGIGLGTMRLNGDGCIQLIMAALTEGYRYLDTARKYGNETEIGVALQRSGISREQVLISTKLGPEELASEQVEEATRDSLRRLKTDYVDLLLIHWPNPDVPLEGTLGTMIELRDRGLARAIGVANFPTELLREARIITDNIVTNQVEYHPYLDQDSVLEDVRAAGMVLSAYCPLARKAVLDDSLLASVGKSHGYTPAQTALRWLVQQRRVVAIPGASSIEQVRDNLAVLDGPELTGAEVREISRLARGRRVVNPTFAPVWDPPRE